MQPYIPRIFLCGDEADFFAKVDARPYKIVRRAESPDALGLDDFDSLKNLMLGDEFDYLVLTTLKNFAAYNKVAVKNDFISAKAVTAEQFNDFPKEFFYDPNVGYRLLAWLRKFSVKTLLDADGFFAKSKIFGGNGFTEIDCVTEENLPPIVENIYRHAYKNFAQVGLKRYDAIFLAEREPLEFDLALNYTKNLADKIFTYARKGSELEKHLLDTKAKFSSGKGLRLATGNLFFVERKVPKTFKMFVVTHKKTPHEGKLPDGYEIIHAGHALSTEDFGYGGDDTGDNISDLNLYLNELTALYWFWKNTSEEFVGLCHYRRFFSASDDKFAYEKILSREDALKVLATHDIILGKAFFGVLNQREFVANDCGEKLAHIGETILRKHLLKHQPNYLDALEFVLNSKEVFKCNMFVTRRNVLDAFCTWLFSFVTDATREILRTAHLEKFSWTPRRLMSFLAERMLHVWLYKQRLRIKELNVMFVEGI